MHPHNVSACKHMLSGCQRLVVITGAGISTDSGIPDYRSPGRPAHKPTMHHEFMKSEGARKRYWARGMIGKILFVFCWWARVWYCIEGESKWCTFSLGGLWENWETRSIDYSGTHSPNCDISLLQLFLSFSLAHFLTFLFSLSLSLFSLSLNIHSSV